MTATQRAAFALILLVLLAGCHGDDDGPPSPGPGDGDAERGEPELPSPSMPTASIVVDGNAGDWRNIPVRVRNEPGVTSSYRPTTVKVAADGENLYVLFELGLGLRERFDQQVRTGQVSSGALGYLNITVDGVRHRCWLPVSVAMSFRGGQPSWELGISYELMRAKGNGDEFSQILARTYPADEGYFGIAGKHVEFKIPLSSLAARKDSRWQIDLDAF